MRTLTQYAKVIAPGLRPTGMLAISLWMLVCLSSCSSSPPSTASFEPADWHLVQKSPPTYFPKGVSARHPTGFGDGSWILTGDDQKTQYFIPHKSASKKNLIAQARTKENPDREKRIKNERFQEQVDRAANITLLDVVKAPAYLFYHLIMTLAYLYSGVR